MRSATARLAAAVIVLASLLALAPTGVDAQTSPPRLEVDAACSMNVVSVRASGLTPGDTYRVLASAVGTDESFEVGTAPASADGTWTADAPLPLFYLACESRPEWRFFLSDGSGRAIEPIVEALVTFGVPTPALAGFGVPREERTHPALIVAILAISTAILVPTVRAWLSPPPRPED